MQDGGALLPFGGHKGATIAVMVELLAAALTGGRFGFEDEAFRYPGALTANAGQLVIAIDPGATGGDGAAERVALLLGTSGGGRVPAASQATVACRPARPRWNMASPSRPSSWRSSRLGPPDLRRAACRFPVASARSNGRTRSRRAAAVSRSVCMPKFSAAMTRPS
jgi:hypothetical protein